MSSFLQMLFWGGALALYLVVRGKRGRQHDKIRKRSESRFRRKLALIVFIIAVPVFTVMWLRYQIFGGEERIAFRTEYCNNLQTEIDMNAVLLARWDDGLWQSVDFTADPASDIVLQMERTAYDLRRYIDNAVPYCKGALSKEYLNSLTSDDGQIQRFLTVVPDISE